MTTVVSLLCEDNSALHQSDTHLGNRGKAAKHYTPLLPLHQITSSMHLGKREFLKESKIKNSTVAYISPRPSLRLGVWRIAV